MKINHHKQNMGYIKNQGYNYPKPSSPFTPSRPVQTTFTPPPPSYQPSFPTTFAPRPPSPSYGPPAGTFSPAPPATFTPTPRPTYGAPSTSNFGQGGSANYPSSIRPSSPSGGGGGHDPGMPYDFNYAVKDDYYGTDFSHNAVSDGDVVRGEYQVLLPDGRRQIVRYTADWKNGYNAEVTYEGNPVYPAPAASNNNNQQQQYKPNGGY
ncbi:hypothetical protein B566_EDAN003942 [Ephemera danica]|nr:hypothetical protein B566_EDAN003942 [Ephemera danica]